MSTGDGINVFGSYATVQASDETVDGSMSQGANTDIETALTTEKLMFLLDFKVIVTVGTPVVNGTIDIYKRNSDQPAPTVAYPNVFVGSAVLDAQTGNYYIRGVANDDILDKYYTINNSGSTITYSLQVRGRTYGSAV